MEQILHKIGVDTELLNREPLHTREQTLEILGISPKTLWKFEKKNLIKGTTFKAKKYYSTTSILDCIKIDVFRLGWIFTHTMQYGNIAVMFGDHVQGFIQILLIGHTRGKDHWNFRLGHGFQQNQIGKVAAGDFQVIWSKQLQ